MEELASTYWLSLKDWHETSYITLGMDLMEMVEEEKKFHYEYKELWLEGKFFSAKDFREFTGKDFTVDEGTYLAVGGNDGLTYNMSIESKIRRSPP